MMKMEKFHTKRKGVVLLFTILTFTVITIMSVAMMSYALRNKAKSSVQTERFQDKEIAKIGVYAVIQHLEEWIIDNVDMDVANYKDEIRVEVPIDGVTLELVVFLEGETGIVDVDGEDQIYKKINVLGTFDENEINGIYENVFSADIVYGMGTTKGFKVVYK